MEKAMERIFKMHFPFCPPRYRSHEEIGRILGAIAHRYRNADLSAIGYSREGRPLYCLTLGNPAAEKRVLLAANAHGEEMRGTEELLHIAHALLADDFLRDTFLADFRFTFIPTTNPDAREYNLRWAKSRIDLTEYFLTARRMVADAHGVETDIEWGYPFSANEERTIRRPETAAIKSLMDTQRFDLYLNLHGAINAYDTGFWYLLANGTRRRNETIEFLYAAGIESGLPLPERESLEIDLCKKLMPGVHTLVTGTDILKSYGKETKLTEWFKKEHGASSADYLMLKNPGSQCVVAELPTFYHEKYMDMTPSSRRRADVKREGLERSLRRLSDVVIPLLEEALRISSHPALVKGRTSVDDVYIPHIRNEISRLEEGDDGMATLGEVRSSEELSEYWECPGYGRFGVGGVISRLPKEEQARLAHIYQRCAKKAEKCAEQVARIGLRELTFADSITIQARTCLGVLLAYFA